MQIAVSCACKIVSKLKVRPFHSVNSPLVEPVRTRRPSGVHYKNVRSLRAAKNLRTVTTFTGHRILLVDVCTNFVQREVEQLSGYAFGGNSYMIAILNIMHAVQYEILHL